MKMVKKPNGFTMSDAVADVPEEPAKSKKKPLILGLVLTVVGAGGGFFAMSSGMIPLGAPTQETEHTEMPEALPDIVFVEVDPIMISLNSDRAIQHLRFRAQLEVVGAHQRDVEKILPRVTDVLNGYLRALELDDLRDPMALTRLRAQMLRRIQIVAGKERVRDLLIMDFVLN